MRPQLLTFLVALGLLCTAPWQISWAVRLGGALLAVASLHLWVNLIGAAGLFRREARPRAPAAGR